MFDDLISRDENVILKSLDTNDSSLKSWHSIFSFRLADLFSKDSDTFQYNYGRVNGMVPEKVSHFSIAYPKKATNMDTDHHYINFDTEILTRWISRDVLKIFVPVLYFQDLQKQRKAEALYAKSVPTVQELDLCVSLKGFGYWKRNGTWHCTTKKIRPETNSDEYGPKFFYSYNAWIAWDSHIQHQINEAKAGDDWALAQKLRTIKRGSENPK